MKTIKELLLENPLFLEDNPETNEVSDFYLPYSTGFEIECSKSENYNADNFKNIPNIMEYKFSESESRFRIPSGLQGFKCLFNITEALCENNLLNDESGIHYHIDFTDCFDNITDEVIKEISGYVLSELDTWGYKGTYNRREILRSRAWVRVHSTYKTLEFRIGEMTFDYSLIVQRIIHLNKICKVIKKTANLHASVSEIIREEQKQQRILSQYETNIRKVIQNRKIRVGE